MAREDGREYNPETATDLRPRDFRFDAYGYAFRYTVQIPEYILAKLDSGAMDKLYDHMSAYAQEVVTDAIKGGYFDSEHGRVVMRSDVGKHLKNYIWERFSIAQQTAGNECWQTAPSLQEVRA